MKIKTIYTFSHAPAKDLEHDGSSVNGQETDTGIYDDLGEDYGIKTVERLEKDNGIYKTYHPRRNVSPPHLKFWHRRQLTRTPAERTR